MHLLLSVPAVEPTQEQGSKMVGASSRDGLHARDSSIRDRRGVGPEDQLGSGRGEFGQSSNWQVLVVEFVIVQ